jgi:hypothetical protein
MPWPSKRTQINMLCSAFLAAALYYIFVLAPLDLVVYPIHHYQRDLFIILQNNEK